MSVSRPAGRRPVALIGFMGAGKSRAARSIAETLGVPAFDTDQAIEERSGSTIEEIFEREGEGYFRALEREAVIEAIDGAASSGGVVALGGGAVTDPQVRDVVARRALAVHLEVDPGTAFERVMDAGRPLAGDPERFIALFAKRAPLYDLVADVTIPDFDGDLGPRMASDLMALAEADVPPNVKVVWAVSPAGDYPVVFGRGALLLAGLWTRSESFFVSDENVWSLYGDKVASAGENVSGVALLPPGEESKRLSEAERILREMARCGIMRQGVVVATGGGVVGDVAGFCAAVYQRGIEVVQIPTTLVAQVDSALGGKTGVDLPEGKNQVGAFHLPRAVVVDPGVLESLPNAEVAAGFAEVIKTGLLAGGELWEGVKASNPGAPPIDAVVLACMRVKLEVVAGDPLDSGRRAVLNLGHTVGHGIEAATGYSRYRHGEAVALGLLAALEISQAVTGCDPGVRTEVSGLLESHGLPVLLSNVAASSVFDALSFDKKRSGGRVKWVLLEAPGRPVYDLDVPDDLVRTAIRSLFRV